MDIFTLIILFILAFVLGGAITRLFAEYLGKWVDSFSLWANKFTKK